MIAHRKFADACANGGHFTGAIRHRDARRGWPPGAADDRVVVVIERAGADADGDFTCLGRQ